jgi:hypothetical protein
MLQGWLEFQAMKRGTNLSMRQWQQGQTDV